MDKEGRVTKAEVRGPWLGAQERRSIEESFLSLTTSYTPVHGQRFVIGFGDTHAVPKEPVPLEESVKNAALDETLTRVAPRLERAVPLQIRVVTADANVCRSCEVVDLESRSVLMTMKDVILGAIHVDPASLPPRSFTFKLSKAEVQARMAVARRQPPPPLGEAQWLGHLIHELVGRGVLKPMPGLTIDLWVNYVGRFTRCKVQAPGLAVDRQKLAEEALLSLAWADPQAWGRRFSIDVAREVPDLGGPSAGTPSPGASPPDSPGQVPAPARLTSPAGAPASPGQAR
ncbi:MAG: hypothetical protein HY815_04090 [Candidatus Riflebacteria bacterium]|nr:hypothetical protein [Candidatus Riflebacteria bacterium]